MLKKSLNSIFQSPVKSAAAAIFIWAVLTNTMFFLGDRVIDNLLFQVSAFMVIYPIGTLILCFIYAKSNGFRWYFYASMALITAAEYFLVPNFNAIIPNILITTLLCMVFGGGIGNCFADKAEIEAKKEQKKLKKNHEDEKYKKILDD